MIVIVFRSRLNPACQAEYEEWACRMSMLAKGIPGHVSHKGFTAQDGERVTIVEFETEEGMRAWAAHPEHVAAKKKGRGSFFSEYSVKICQLQRESGFRDDEAATRRQGQRSRHARADRRRWRCPAPQAQSAPTSRTKPTVSPDRQADSMLVILLLLRADGMPPPRTTWPPSASQIQSTSEADPSYMMSTPLAYTGTVPNITIMESPMQKAENYRFRVQVEPFQRALADAGKQLAAFQLGNHAGRGFGTMASQIHEYAEQGSHQQPQHQHRQFAAPLEPRGNRRRFGPRNDGLGRQHLGAAIVINKSHPAGCIATFGWRLYFGDCERAIN